MTQPDGGYASSDSGNSDEPAQQLDNSDDDSSPATPINSAGDTTSQDNTPAPVVPVVPSPSNPSSSSSNMGLIIGAGIALTVLLVGGVALANKRK